MDEKEIIKLYRSAYYNGYIANDIHPMEDFDDAFGNESYLEVIETYIANREYFDSNDDYFISTGTYGILISYQEDELAIEILREYKSNLKEFYNNKKEQFLRVLGIK